MRRTPIFNGSNAAPSRITGQALFIAGGLQAKVTASSEGRVEKIPKTQRERLRTLCNWGKKLPTDELTKLAEDAGIHYQKGWQYIRDHISQNPKSANLFGDPEFLTDYRYRQLQGVFLPITDGGRLFDVLSLHKKLLKMHILDASYNLQDNIGYSNRAGVFLADFGELVTTPEEIVASLAGRSWRLKRWYRYASNIVQTSVDAHFEGALKDFSGWIAEAPEIKATH